MGYNLQGIIRRSTVNTLTQFERVGVVSQAMSNLNTTAYKGVRFDEVMYENGYAKYTLRTDHSQGSIRNTSDPLDIAIKGPGFIPIVSKSGEIFYTRDGQFAVDKEGTLVTSMGEVVGGGIRIPIDYEKLEIRPDGSVYSYYRLPCEGEYHGTIPLVLFGNPEGLKEVGGNKYAKTDTSGEATLLTGHTRIAQGNIELSNVSVFDTVNEMMRTNASLLASTQLITAIDKMYEKAINIRQ